MTVNNINERKYLIITLEFDNVSLIIKKLPEITKGS